MKKKLALILCLVMLVSLFAGCGDSGEKQSESPKPSGSEAVKPSDSQPVESQPAESQPAAPVEPEALPEALYHWDFETTDGLTAVGQVEKAADSPNTGATYDIAPVDQPILTTDGVVGKCLYLDGKYGVKLDTLQALSGDEYTVSFWVNATRLSVFGPVVQIGRNIGHVETDDNVTWLNFTKADKSWVSDKDVFPIAWNRNTGKGSFPWISVDTLTEEKTEYGKREWALATLVADGVGYTADDGLPRIGAKLYINGELKFDANADNLFYQGVSPEILMGDGVEGYIGINYWDTIFKGFIDELYVFDKALTPGQVLTLYQQGDTSNEPVAPEGGSTEPEPEVPAIKPVENITADPAAIAAVGTPDLTLPFWGGHSDGYELADGKTVTMKLHNYSSAANNWSNFVVALANMETKATPTPSADNYPGYAEYAVFRADAHGWGDASYNGTFETSWTDWNAWLQLMTDADVTLVMSRSGGVVTADITFTGADGTEMTEKATITSTMTADSPCWFFLTGEACYIEILSVA